MTLTDQLREKHPYPTHWPYELCCKAADALELKDIEIARLRGLLADAKRMAEFGDINETMDDDGIGWKQWYLDVRAALAESVKEDQKVVQR